MQNRRIHLQQLLALTLISGTAGCGHGTLSSRSDRPNRPLLDALVDLNHPGEPGQGIGEIPRYRTLEQALAAAPMNAAQPWRIGLRPGIYREKLEIARPNIHLIGDERGTTVISHDAYSGQTRPDGVGTWTTFGCATLTVRAPGFAASNLTIENSYDYLVNDAKLPTDPTYTNDPQAVALMLAKGSDRASLRRVNITGYQDTLFVDGGRSLFRECRVSGNVDFIFGAGQAVFDGCEIVSRPRRKPNVWPHGYVTAPSTDIGQRYGLVFLRCRLLRENDQVPARSHALGRPWHPAANFPDGRYADPKAIGSSVFIECFMDEHIHGDGWWSMTGLQKSGPARTVFLPEDARFFEYRSSGPGALSGARRRQLDAAQAAEYTLAHVFGKWSAPLHP